MKAAELRGQNIVFALAGVGRSEQLKQASVGDTLSGVEAEPFHRATCRFVKMAYEQAGRQTDLGWALFTRLSEAPEWDPAYNRFMKIAYAALGRRYGHLVKDAGVGSAMGGAFLADAAGKGMKMGPEIFQMLVAAGLLTGSSLGALHWGVKRHSNQDDPEVEKLQAQRDQYNALTEDINSNLLAKGFQ